MLKEAERIVAHDEKKRRLFPDLPISALLPCSVPPDRPGPHIPRGVQCEVRALPENVDAVRRFVFYMSGLPKDANKYTPMVRDGEYIVLTVWIRHDRLTFF